ncbi:MAG: YggT family protein [Candidatus Saccharimonadales bacterium]
MAEQLIRETVTDDGETVSRTKKVSTDDPGVRANDSRNLAERVVWFIAGIILVLLAFRFVLSLLGANRNNAFADFIYSISQPFVAPFFSLFSYNNYDYGVSRFEVYTLFAMLVYAVAAWGISALINLNRK